MVSTAWPVAPRSLSWGPQPQAGPGPALARKTRSHSLREWLRRSRTNLWAGLHGDRQMRWPITCRRRPVSASAIVAISVTDSSLGRCYVRGGSSAAPPECSTFDWQDGVLSSQSPRKNALDGQVWEPLAAGRLGGSVCAGRGAGGGARGESRAGPGAGRGWAGAAARDAVGPRRRSAEGSSALKAPRQGELLGRLVGTQDHGVLKLGTPVSSAPAFVCLLGALQSVATTAAALGHGGRAGHLFAFAGTCCAGRRGAPGGRWRLSGNWPGWSRGGWPGQLAPSRSRPLWPTPRLAPSPSPS